MTNLYELFGKAWSNGWNAISLPDKNLCSCTFVNGELLNGKVYENTVFNAIDVSVISCTCISIL